MFYPMWSAKGGVGLSVTAAALVVAQANLNGGALIIDIAGDVAPILGVRVPSGPGLNDWLESKADTPGSLMHLSTDVGCSVRMIHSGTSAIWPHGRITDLLDAITALDLPVVIDCGQRPAGPPSSTVLLRGEVLSQVELRTSLVEHLCKAGRPILVTSPCYLALGRTLDVLMGQDRTRNADDGSGAHGVIVVKDPGRALDAADVESITQLRLLAEIERDPSVARTVDAGLFLRRQPRALIKKLESIE